MDVEVLNDFRSWRRAKPGERNASWESLKDYLMNHRNPGSSKVARIEQLMRLQPGNDIHAFNTEFVRLMELAGWRRDSLNTIAAYRLKMPCALYELLVVADPQTIDVAMQLVAARVQARLQALRRADEDGVPMQVDTLMYGPFEPKPSKPAGRQKASRRPKANLPLAETVAKHGGSKNKYEERLRSGHCLVCGSGEHRFAACPQHLEKHH
ncbi:hypothetical protein GQ54DRAFT_302646 [Martensiomyces pterosporus]|nr:hypothetical protein GQ54DRAFT_302646 [Martensiomyces pterosporus]